MSEVARLTIEVRSNTARAVASLARLDGAVRSASQSIGEHDRRMQGSTRAMGRLHNTTNRMAASANNAGQAFNNGSGGMGRFARMARIVSIGAVALFPVLQGGLAVLGGLTSAFTLAGGAAGVFGLAVVSYMKNTKAGKAEVEGLSRAFDRFGKSTAKAVSSPVHNFFAGLRRALGNLVPLVQATAPAVNKVAVAFRKWTGNRLQQWVGFISSKGVPILEHFMSIGRSLAATFGQVVIQFQPFGSKIVSVLDRGAASMAKWARGGGFSRFMETVKKNGPGIKDFFTTLWDATKNLLGAMNQLGPLGLGITTMFLKMIAAVDPKVLSALIIAFIGWKTAMMAINVWNKILALSNLMLGTSFLAVTGPIVIIIAACAALVAAIIWVATKTTWFQTAWKYTWNAVKAVFWATFNFLKSVFSTVVNFLGSKWGWLIAVIGPVGWLIALAMHWRQVWGAIKAVGQAIWNFMKTAWRVTTGAIVGAARSALNFIKRVWNASWNWVRAKAISVWNFLKRAWSGTVNSIRNAALWIARAVRSAWNAVWNWVRNKSAAVWNWLKAAWSRTVNALRNSTRWVKNTITNLWRSLWNWVGDKAKAVWNWIVDKAKSFGKSLVNRFKDIKDRIGDAWNKLKNIFKAPVKFLIEVVINKGIIGSANWLIDKLGGGKNTIKKVKMPKGFATGGYTGNGGKYTPAGIVHRGEYVVNKAATSKIGVSQLHHMNRTGEVPGYAKGGFAGFTPNFGKSVPSIKGAIKSKKEKKGWFEKTLDAGLGMAGMGAAVQLKDVLKGASSWIGDVKGAAGGVGGIMGPMFKGVVGKIWNVLKDVFKSVWEANQATGNGYKAAPAWKGGDGERVSYHGAAMNVRTMRMLKHAEALYGRMMGVTQGSYSNSVGASAGTHSGGGVLDLSATSNKAIGALRASGFAAWHRTPAEGFSHHTHAVAVGDPTMSSAARNQVSAFFKGKNGLANNGPDTYIPPGGGKGSSSGSNRSIVSRVLRELGESQANLPNVMRAMMKESGGNPRAINNWDSNAKAGMASRGLMQVIPPTFRAYAGKYKNRSIYDPYANVYAAIRYARSRYGSGWSARMARPGGYATGVQSAPRGLAWVGEQGPELMNFRGGESVTPNRESMLIASGSGSGGGDTYNVTVNLNGANLSSSRQIEDAVVAAIEKAKRKGRRI